MNKELTFEQIEHMWMNEHVEKLNIYTHIPFCESVCKYCMFRGTVCNEEIKNKYFFEYLPEQIKKYSPIIEKLNVTSFAFGGGTPNIMSPEIMRHVFDLYPKFRETKSKLMEIHPGLCTTEQLDVLGEYGFNSVILGIQTFNEDMLKKQGRIPNTYDKVKEISEHAKSLGLNVLSDLIIFDTTDEYITTFQEDLDMLKSLNPDNANIHLERKGLLGNLTDIDLKKYAVLIYHTFLMRGEYKYLIELEEYNSFDGLFESLKETSSIHLIRRDVSEYEFRNDIYASAHTMDDLARSGIHDYSVIGIGEYNNVDWQKTFSFIKGKLQYIESNENWEAKYYELYNDNNEPKLEDFIRYFFEAIAHLGETPEGIEFGFSPFIFQDGSSEGDIARIKKAFTVNIQSRFETMTTSRYVQECGGIARNIIRRYGWNG